MVSETQSPALQTNLSLSERLVGLFVTIAMLLLLGAFAYYLIHTSEKRGWFVTRAPYFTYVRSANGMYVGDKVKLMGFDVGEITMIEAMPADDPLWNVYVEFTVKAPYYGYLWTDSSVKVIADLLGSRYLEVTKGVEGSASYEEKAGKLVGIYDGEAYQPIAPDTKPFWLVSDETSAINDRAENLLSQVEQALPGIFALTNQLSGMLSNATRLTASLDRATIAAQPTIANMALISTSLTNSNGSLGQWLIPTNINQEIESTLTRAGTTMASADQNMTLAVSNINLTLTTVATLTSNLNTQVAVNTNILHEISTLIVTANDFMESLQGHWILRSAFRKSKN
ncbi:MlaD family protein [Verrucomicrobia bacterium]|jgi:ABC-type transporter Mla subunit MlaD|nr:MlaD family protein [Verrucomicrobiota bacterium]